MLFESKKPDVDEGVDVEKPAVVVVVTVNVVVAITVVTKGRRTEDAVGTRDDVELA